MNFDPIKKERRKSRDLTLGIKVGVHVWPVSCCAMPTTAATGLAVGALVRLCAVAVTPFAFRRAPASFGLLWRAGLLVLLPALASIPAQQQPQEWPSPPPMSGNPLLVPHAPSAIPAGQAVPLATSPGDGIPTLHAPHTAHPRFRRHAPDFPSLSHDTPDRHRPHRQTRRRRTTRRTTSGDHPRQRRHHRRCQHRRHFHRQLHSPSSAPSPRTTRQS